MQHLFITVIYNFIKRIFTRRQKYLHHIENDIFTNPIVFTSFVKLSNIALVQQLYLMDICVRS